jgi:hypothetical protein
MEWMLATVVRRVVPHLPEMFELLMLCEAQHSVFEVMTVAASHRLL